MTIFVLTNKYVIPKIPSCLPKKSPKIIPSDKGLINKSKVKAFRGTPELIKANKDNIKNETHGCMVFSIETKRDVLLWDPFLIGIVNANKTPAIDVCTPDFKTNNQSNMPSKVYRKAFLTLQFLHIY